MSHISQVSWCALIRDSHISQVSWWALIRDSHILLSPANFVHNSVAHGVTDHLFSFHFDNDQPHSSVFPTFRLWLLAGFTVTPVLDCSGRLGLLYCVGSAFCTTVSPHLDCCLHFTVDYIVSIVFVLHRMRFPDVFVACEEARKLQQTIEEIIGKSIGRRFPKFQRQRGEIIKCERELRLTRGELDSFLEDLKWTNVSKKLEFKVSLFLYHILTAATIVSCSNQSLQYSCPVYHSHKRGYTTRRKCFLNRTVGQDHSALTQVIYCTITEVICTGTHFIY